MGFSEDRASGRYGPRYVLVAENPYLLWDAVEDWKRLNRRVGQLPLDSFHAPKIDIDRLLDVGATIPMFGEQRLVLIHDINKVPAPQQEKLMRALKVFGESTRVVATASGLDKRLKFTKFLLSWADVEEFPRIYTDRLPGWAQRIAADLGWQLAPNAAGLLASTLGDDLFAVRQTIERTTLYIGQKRRIELADIEAGLTGDGQHSVFLLLDAVSEPNLERSIRIVRSLFAGTDRPELWLGALTTLLQRLLKLSEINEPNDFQASRQTGIHPKFIGQARRQVAYFGQRGLTAALYGCFETEWGVKTSRFTPRLGWELLTYRLCTKKVLLRGPLLSLENPHFEE